jgi:hypothetical protein
MDKKVFNPERIGMQFCPGCGGSGRNDGEVYQGCGGFGLVRKIENIGNDWTSNRLRSLRGREKNRFQDLFLK